jgi:hypothetical protein
MTRTSPSSASRLRSKANHSRSSHLPASLNAGGLWDNAGEPVGTGSPGEAHTRAGARLYGYGDSSLRGGATRLSPQSSVAAVDIQATDGWSHAFESATPGVPGDSGSAWLDLRGRAVADGLLSRDIGSSSAARDCGTEICPSSRFARSDDLGWRTMPAEPASP